MPCYSPLKGYKDSETGGLKFKGDGAGDTMEVACGQCIGCRLDRSRMWAARIVHESSMPENRNGNCFVTLTYRPYELSTQQQRKEKLHIPYDWNLSVPVRNDEGKQIKQSHFQGFMKRLRKEYSDRKIKFFMCGEYGNICKHGINLQIAKCPMCNLGRPHYHACLFNVSFDDIEPYATQQGQTRFTSRKLENLWKYGFVDVGGLEYQSAAYVARYCLKKVTGVNAEDHYQYMDPAGDIHQMNPEFATMSNGVGKTWFEKYRTDCFPSDEMPVPGTGVIKKVPRYYQELEEAENPELIEEVKANRERYRMENAEEYSPERLMAKYNVKKAQVALLKRTV